MKTSKQDLMEELKLLVDSPEQLSPEALELLNSTEDMLPMRGTSSEGITPDELIAQLDEAKAAAAGDLIGQARKARGLSTRSLGEKLKISGPRVSQTQNAGNAVEVQTLARYATAMGYRLKLSFVPEEGGEEIAAEIKAG